MPPPPPGFRAVLEWLRQYGNLDLDLADPGAAAPESVRAWQARLTKEQRKFHKFDPDHPHPALTASGKTDPSRVGDAFSPAPMETDEDSPDGGHPRGITAQQIAYIRQLRANASERRLWIALGIAVVAFLLVAGAFLASHIPLAKIFAGSHDQTVPAQTSASAPDDAGIVSPGVMDLLDQAMAAEAASDDGKAIELLERAQHETGHIYGLNYRLAALSYRANEMPRVLPLLNRSIADGEDVAACYSLRGLLSNQIEGTPPEPGDLERATRLDPLNARFFFVWGEALRQAGKFQLALPQLQRAVDRAQEPALAAIYALKLRLTQTELGQADAFANELAAKLEDVPPPVDWLLTAAATQMHGGDFPAAAATLDRIRTLVGERETARHLQDVFFKNFAHETELARFFEVSVSP